MESQHDINPLAWHYSLVRNEAFVKLPPADLYPGGPRVEQAKNKNQSSMLVSLGDRTKLAM